MDWVRDGQVIPQHDLKTIFKYEPKEATVVRVFPGNNNPTIHSLMDDSDWARWNKESRPRLNHSDASGLVLLLAKRGGELGPCRDIKRSDSKDWLRNMDEKTGFKSSTTLDSGSDRIEQMIQNIDGIQDLFAKDNLRKVPFDQESFPKIMGYFHLHNSISRAISRARSPTFSYTRTNIEEDGKKYPACVYTCRTTNEWVGDLALSVTYFPHSGLSFAVLFGCTLSTEIEIVKRLTKSTTDAEHPLLMVGIVAEFERQRNIHTVENAINDLETRILEFGIDPDAYEGLSNEELQKIHRDKREAYLDTGYLVNCLKTWQVQLGNLLKRAEEEQILIEEKLKLIEEDFPITEKEKSESWEQIPEGGLYQPEDSGDIRFRKTSQESLVVNVGATITTRDGEDWKRTRERLERMRETGFKICNRLHALIQEYDGKIRDCTMRIDGMAMAAQWAHAETNMEIAKATSRDSKHMRSIALVTMIFLPGTFFAGLFSTTFFDWNGGGVGGKVVSSYFWIYVLFTVVFTLGTVGLWYYFSVFRRLRLQRKRQERLRLADLGEGGG